MRVDVLEYNFEISDDGARVGKDSDKIIKYCDCDDYRERTDALIPATSDCDIAIDFCWLRLFETEFHWYWERLRRVPDIAELSFLISGGRLLCAFVQSLRFRALLWLCLREANVNSRSRSLYVVVRPSVCRLSVTFVHPTQATEIFGNGFMSFGTLAICWHPGKILRTSSPGNPSVWGVKH